MKYKLFHWLFVYTSGIKIKYFFVYGYTSTLGILEYLDQRLGRLPSLCQSTVNYLVLFF